MIVSPIRGGKNTKDATISAKEVLFNEVAYGKDGRIVGEAPLSFKGSILTGQIPFNTNWSSVCYGDGKYVAVCMYEESSEVDEESSEVDVETYNKDYCAAYSIDGVNWSPSYLPEFTGYSICYGNDMFVALNPYGFVAYSMDGINWTVSDMPQEGFVSICYGNGVFVAVSSNRIAYSNDAINWTLTDDELICTFPAICYANGKFTIVDRYKTLSSVDGISWSTDEHSMDYKYWFKLCYLEGTYILSSQFDTVWGISQDGINWSVVSLFSNSMLAYSSDDMVVFVPFNGGEILYLHQSEDTPVKVKDVIINDMTIVTCFGNHRWVIIDRVGGVVILDEIDGKLEAVVSDDGDGCYKLEDIENGMLIQGSNGYRKTLIVNDSGTIGFEGEYDTSDATATSLNIANGETAYGIGGVIEGIMPIQYYSGDPNAPELPSVRGAQMCYGGGKFILPMTNTDSIAYSTDGINWQYADDLYINGKGYYSCAYGNGIYIAIGYQKAAYSLDGITWIQANIPSNFRYTRAFYGKDRFIALEHPYSGTSIAYSLDGITWQTKSSVIPYLDWQCGCYGNNKYVIVADTGEVVCSEDGITYTQTTKLLYGEDRSGGTNRTMGGYHSICYFNGNFFAFTENHVAFSEDGKTWDYIHMPIRSFAACCGDDKIVAVGYQEAAYSLDGEEWSNVKIYSDDILHSVCYGANKFIATAKGEKAGETYSSTLVYSSDGIEWVSRYYIGNITTENFPVYLTRNGVTPRKLVYYANGYYIKFEGDYTTTDATIEPKELMSGEIGYGASGKVVGTAPLTFVQESVEYAINIPLKSWTSIVYANDVFVAVAKYTDTIIYSTDGINWEEVSMPLTNRKWYSICYGNGKFVTVSRDSSDVAYSLDGINWTSTTLPISTTWESVCYGNGIFIATSYNDNVSAFSTDGISWEQSTLPFESYTRQICFGHDKFVIVGEYRGSAYSIDGINWTQSNLSDSVYWVSVCYSEDKGMFVAIAYNSDVAAYSTDGINWAQSTMPVSDRWYSVTYGNGKFVTVSENGYSKVAAYSTDGINWIKTKMPVSSKCKSVCYGNGKFIAISYDSDFIMYSINGIDWGIYGADTYQLENTVAGMNITAEGCDERHLIVSKSEPVWHSITPSITANLQSVCYGNGVFVALGLNSNTILYSTNGTNWNSSVMPVAAYWRSVCYGNGKFVAVAQNNNISAYSIDGISWTQTMLPSGSGADSICYGNGTFIAVNDSGQSLYSTDGITWNRAQVETGRSHNLYSVCYGNGKFVSLNQASKSAFYSADGITWTKTNLPSQAYWQSVCYDNGKFVAVAVQSRYGAYSEDGITWTQFDLTQAYNWYSVCYGDGMFVVVAMDNTVYAYSVDGVNWTVNSDSLEHAYWYDICYGDGKFIAVSDTYIACRKPELSLRFEDEVTINAEEVEF